VDDVMIGLSDSIRALRTELEDALDEGADARIRFTLKPVELVVQVVARRDAEAGGKVRWFVFEGGGTAKLGSEVTQTLRLQLEPVTVDPLTGARRPAEVTDDVAQRST
jgi:hypothetical protein